MTSDNDTLTEVRRLLAHHDAEVNAEVVEGYTQVYSASSLWAGRNAKWLLDTLRRLADECEALRVTLAQRIATSGMPPVVDVTHYVPLDINVLRGNAAPEPPPRETGADGSGDDSPA